MMKRWSGTGLLAGLVAMAFVAVSGCGQAPNHSASGGGSKTAVVDLNAVAKALGRDEAIQRQLQSATQQLNQKLVQAAQQMQQQLNEQQKQLSDSEKEASQEDLQKLKERFVRARRNVQVNKAKAQLVQRQAKAQLVQQFRQEVKPIAQGIAEQQGADVVVVSNANVLWFDRSSDITDEVIAEMRAAGHSASSGSSSQQGTSSGSGGGSTSGGSSPSTSSGSTQNSGSGSDAGSGSAAGDSSSGGSSSGE